MKKIKQLHKMKLPNKETLKAMQEVKDRKVISAENVDELMKKLLA
ncbi:MAG: hypothetical protein V4622_04485 [Bacteroidota bacterium]